MNQLRGPPLSDFITAADALAFIACFLTFLWIELQLTAYPYSTAALLLVADSRYSVT